MLVGGKLLEVLDKALCQILSLRLPLSGISVSISWIEDSGVYAWQLRRDGEVEVG